MSRRTGPLPLPLPLLVLLAAAATPDSDAGVCPRIVSREEWGARPARHVEEMRNPVHSVIIHHTYIPGACITPAECAAAMRAMQDSHQRVKGWDDIGYSFVIGGDGRVYKGRGWNRHGAHSPPYNGDSIGIALIGDWRFEAPPQAMLDTAQWLIRCGVDTGRVSSGYQLMGHRQVRPTECPGDALFDVIKTWEHWTPRPRPPGVPAETDDDDANTTTDASVATAPPETSSPLDTGDVMAGAPIPAETVKYDPMPPATGGSPMSPTDTVEVRQLNKRSLWDRLVHIWQQEALRLQREASAASLS